MTISFATTSAMIDGRVVETLMMTSQECGHSMPASAAAIEFFERHQRGEFS